MQVYCIKIIKIFSCDIDNFIVHIWNHGQALHRKTCTANLYNVSFYTSKFLGKLFIKLNDILTYPGYLILLVLVLNELKYLIQEKAFRIRERQYLKFNKSFLTLLNLSRLNN